MSISWALDTVSGTRVVVVELTILVLLLRTYNLLGEKHIN